ncbi:hypothetical protein EVAR_16621_1 [Eumeta japonica]|uniref:Uncharacterized protein n=1 Tax=Eumeta variegata TaxID=151549 RepID=A0A4C1V0R7_EUMVA|nr:hypothetical protein EVAR_16621_1 [Eumeta japonica]
MCNTERSVSRSNGKSPATRSGATSRRKRLKSFLYGHRQPPLAPGGFPSAAVPTAGDQVSTRVQARDHQNGVFTIADSVDIRGKIRGFERPYRNQGNDCWPLARQVLMGSLCPGQLIDGHEVRHDAKGWLVNSCI